MRRPERVARVMSRQSSEEREQGAIGELTVQTPETSQSDRIAHRSPSSFNHPGDRNGRLPGGRFWPARWLLLVVPGVSIGLILWLSWTKAPLLPTGDEWSMVPLFERFTNGTLTFADLWEPNGGGHRLLWTRVQALAVIWLTGWDHRLMLIISVLLVVLTWLLLMDAVRRTFQAPWAVWILLIPTALLIFSLARHHTWLKPYTDKVPTTLAFAIVVWALAEPRTKSGGWFLIALVGALKASLSSLGGLVVWIAFLPAVLERSRKLAVIWVLTAATTIGLYSVDYPFNRRDGSLSLSPDDVLFVFAWLGNPVAAGDSQRALAVGIASAVGLATALTFLYWPLAQFPRGAPKSVLVWLGLAASAVGIALLVSIDRRDAEPSQASRFLDYSVLWWVALLVIGLAAVVRGTSQPGQLPADARSGRGKLLTAAYLGAVLLTLVGTISTSQYGFQRGVRSEQDQLEAEACVLQEPLTEECVASLGNPRKIGPSVSFLREEGLAIFR